MKKIGLYGGGFQHAFSTTLNKHPKHFEWNINKTEKITFFVDDAIKHGLDFDCEFKAAWLVESKSVIPGATEFVKNNYELVSKSYDILISHDMSIYSLADNFHYLPPHGYWIENPSIYPKTKLISMISSNKGFLNGHQFRLNWVNKLKNKLDLYGRGFNDIETKDVGLKDYMFSVVIENDSYESYWSEKILDAFVTGTVPIYYGSPDIGKFFNTDGIIMLNDEFDINQLTEKDYYDRMDAIVDNFDRALKFNVIEDLIFEKWIQ
jgi:hypothetical protein